MVFVIITALAITLAPMTVSAYTVDSALITTVQGYIDSSKTQASQEKWTRALAGLGGATHENPMTAQEAQINAYKFDPNRWNPVVEAMAALQGVTVDKPAALIAAVQDYAAETNVGSEHVDRWNRVLAALGSGTHDSPMTAAEAQEFADRGWKRWVPVVDVLTVLESQPTQWEESLDPQYAPQNSNPTRQERIAEARQIIQEMKSIAAELRQDLDEVTAFVNTLDNKAHYPGSLALAETDLSDLKGVITRAENELSIMGSSNYENSFKEIMRLDSLVRNSYATAINDRLAPILVLSEWAPKVQEMRAISAEANAMMAEAREFLKKWDETPTTYADAIEKAERAFRWIDDTNNVDKNYQKLRNNPFSTTAQQSLNGLYEITFKPSIAIMKEALETLLSTARQQTEKEQCAQPDVECDWHSGSNSMTVKQFDHTDSDDIRTVITYYESGDIQQYNVYYPHSTQKEFEIIYYDPYNTRNCFDVQNTADKSDKKIAKEHCRGQIHQTTTWYSNGNIAQETSYHAPSTNGVNRMTADKVLTKDGRTVFNIYLIDFQTKCLTLDSTHIQTIVKNLNIVVER